MAGYAFANPPDELRDAFSKRLITLEAGTAA
jgi:hypothetical protein